MKGEINKKIIVATKLKFFQKFTDKAETFANKVDKGLKRIKERKIEKVDETQLV